MVACHKYDDSIVMILLVVIINSAFMSYVFVCNNRSKEAAYFENS